MRRFSFKSGFTYSEPKQAEAPYKKVLAPLAKGRRMRPETKKRPLSLKYLTPGDFRTVKTRRRFYEPESLTHEMLVDALAAEQEMKHDAAREDTPRYEYVSISDLFVTQEACSMSAFEESEEHLEKKDETIDYMNC